MQENLVQLISGCVLHAECSSQRSHQDHNEYSQTDQNHDLFLKCIDYKK